MQLLMTLISKPTYEEAVMRPDWLMWINPDDEKQIFWASKYLARNGYADFAFANPYLVDGAIFIRKMAGYEHDMYFRRRADKMRAAWRQKRYRAGNGKQTAFQLPDPVRADLDRLAKAQRKTKVETLRQIISDAANLRDCEKREVKEAKEAHKKKVKELEARRLKEVGVYKHISTYLLDAFAEELCLRCGLEATVGPWDNSVLEGDSMDTYLALVEKRITELEAGREGPRLAQLSSPPLRRRMQKLARKHMSASFKAEAFPGEP